MKNIENSMKATLEQLEKMSKSFSDDEAGNDDEAIFKEVGLDLESLAKIQDEAFADMSNTIDILYVNKSKLENPKYNHREDSGFDIRANIEGDITLSTLERTLIPTGLHFQIHEDYELQIRPKKIIQ